MISERTTWTAEQRCAYLAACLCPLVALNGLDKKIHRDHTKTTAVLLRLVSFKQANKAANTVSEDNNTEEAKLLKRK